MSKILISYRREDHVYITDRIYDRLMQAFPNSVFRDLASIPFSDDFIAYLDEQVANCEVFLVVIGRDWLEGKGRKGKSRLEEPDDFVRIEIECALKRQIPVIPVLVQGARIPETERLPVSIQELSYRNGIVVRHDPDFHEDMDLLIAHLKQPFQRLTECQTTLISESRPVTELRLIIPSEPGDMVKVSKGPFLYGEQKICVVIDHDYWIDQYPVTNRKFRKFVLDGGYEKKKYWSVDGWRWKTENYIGGPEDWNDTQPCGEAGRPVTNLSYHEAEAYANWVGKRLPSEQEWEKAARGVDGRQYPWGEEFDNSRLNRSECEMEGDLSEAKYPSGISPYGCYDMIGSVSEWCSSWYEESKGLRVIRGGRRGNALEPRNFRVWLRDGVKAGYRGVGFRLAQDII